MPVYKRVKGLIDLVYKRVKGLIDACIQACQRVN